MAPRSLPVSSGAGVRRACATAGLVVLLAGCGGGAKTLTVSHGSAPGRLYGTVTRGPSSPVCRPHSQCSSPASGPLVFSRNRRVVAGVAVREDGSYFVSLAPGTYDVAIATMQPGVGQTLDPATVRVIAGRRRKVDFQIDTGMR